MTLFSLTFLAFFTLFILCYGLAKNNVKPIILAIGNAVFCASWDWRCLVAVFCSSLFVYYIGLRIEHVNSAAQKKTWVRWGVAGVLLILGVFKYFNFFAYSFVLLVKSLGFDCSSACFNIFLPVGISFYSFKNISYLVDVSKGCDADRSFISYFAYASFFPQLLAGPIVRKHDFDEQCKSTMQANDAMIALGMFFWGAVMKIAMADTLAPMINSRYAAWQTVSSADAFTGVFFYSWQIYGDFCGYSLMALGVARMLGYRFGDNFDYPYISTSFQEFWRRWHISLSTWLRDYLYIPLGGSRNGHTRRNLFLTMLLGGLWHGASWTFVLWGGGTWYIALY